MIFKRPVDELFKINSKFGLRKHPVTGEDKMHWGSDFAAPEGTYIFACHDGDIISAKNHRQFGNYILHLVLLNGVRYFLFYCHLSEFFVRENIMGDYPYERVKKGDVIGKVGSTGTSTGPHLHFQICKESALASLYTRNALDPELFF